MNYYANLSLLQKLAHKIDSGISTDLESLAFDSILESLHEKNKNNPRISDTANVGDFPANFFKQTDPSLR
jgi:hypothetical protein